LHTVVAATEQNGTENVEKNMECSVEALDLPAIAFTQSPFVLLETD
jgi:hypothetical protein